MKFLIVLVIHQQLSYLFILLKAKTIKLTLNLTQGIIYINPGETIDAADYIESVTSAQGRALHRVVKMNQMLIILHLVFMKFIIVLVIQEQVVKHG